MSLGNVTTRTLVAVLLAFIAALMFRTWLQLEMLNSGTNRYLAADLSYLVVPPILVFLLFPLWHSAKSFLVSRFDLTDLSWSVVFRAVAIGFLLRLVFWAHVVLVGSFGIRRSNDPAAIVGPEFSFQCSSPLVLALGFAVMAFMIPLIEEVIHRGIIMSYLRQRGQLIAILVSTTLFVLLHSQGSWWYVSIAGFVFGYQYWKSHSLWPSLLSHMTVNGLVQLDWRCLSGAWNPPSTEIPLLIPGGASVLVLIACATGIFLLVAGTAAKRT